MFLMHIFNLRIETKMQKMKLKIHLTEVENSKTLQTVMETDIMNERHTVYEATITCSV